MRVGLTDVMARWEEARNDELRRDALSALRGTEAVAVVSVAARITEGAPKFELWAAPKLDRTRQPLDPEGMFHLAKRASDEGLKTTRGLTQAIGEKQKANAQEQMAKASEALASAQDSSPWGWISKACSWIAAAAAVVSAVATCGATSIVAAACICAHMTLEETGAYGHMGDWGKLVSGLLLTGAACSNWFRFGLAAVDQALEKLGGYEELGAKGAIALRSSLTAASLATHFTSKGDVPSAAAPSGAAAKLQAGAKVVGGLATATSGVAGGFLAYEKYQASSLANEILRLSNQSARFKHLLEDLLGNLDEEVKRRGRHMESATNVEEKRHSTAVAFAAALRG